MSHSPPSFSSQAYWDTRFLDAPQPFEWLQEAPFLGAVLAPLIAAETSRPRTLHIGCGTSDLSLVLRRLVADPARIHNVDFSPVAVELGRQRERAWLVEDARTALADDIVDPAAENGMTDAVGSPTPLMQWSTADLLDRGDVARLKDGVHGYDVIVDKSTSDAIACGPDVLLDGREFVLLDGIWDEAEAKRVVKTGSAWPVGAVAVAVHPLHVLAMHLAYLAAPGARWVALSYASERFPFLAEEKTDRGQSVGQERHACVDPCVLWELESCREVEVEVETREEAQGKHCETVHRPKVVHWLYVLRRTAVRLQIGNGGSV